MSGWAADVPEPIGEFGVCWPGGLSCDVVVVLWVFVAVVAVMSVLVDVCDV